MVAPTDPTNYLDLTSPLDDPLNRDGIEDPLWTDLGEGEESVANFALDQRVEVNPVELRDSSIDASILDSSISSVPVDQADPNQEVFDTPLEVNASSDRFVPSTPDISLDRFANQINPDKSEFKVVRQGESEEKFFFSLLPATKMDQMQGTALNTNDTPGATEGLSILTEMRYQNKPTPSGHPVVDGVGIDSTVVRLVGAFTGFDSQKSSQTISTPNNPPNGSFESYPGGDDVNHSYESALYFSRNIVRKGGEVKVVIQDNSSKNLFIKFFCVLVNFQLYVRQEDLTYYQLDCLLTRYDTA